MSTGTMRVSTSPLMKEYIPTCRLVYFITTGSPLSIVAAPLGASARNLCTRTKSGIKKKPEISRIIFAKNATVPISVLYMALITTEEKLYHPSPPPTSSESYALSPAICPKSSAPQMLPQATAKGMASASSALCRLQMRFKMPRLLPISIPAIKSLRPAPTLKLNPACL